MRLMGLAIAWAACAMPVHGQTPGEAEVAGCYRVEVGPWRLPARGDQARFLEVPAEVELSTARGREGFEVGELLVRPTQGVREGAEWARWRLEADGRVEVLWTTGFTGVRLDLSRRPWGLFGDAWGFVEGMERPPRRARVWLRQMPCG